MSKKILLLRKVPAEGLKATRMCMPGKESRPHCLGCAPFEVVPHTGQTQRALQTERGFACHSLPSKGPGCAVRTSTDRPFPLLGLYSYQVPRLPSLSTLLCSHRGADTVLKSRVEQGLALCKGITVQLCIHLEMALFIVSLPLPTAPKDFRLLMPHHVQ